MSHRALIAERHTRRRREVASLSDAGVLKRRGSRRISPKSDITRLDQVRSIRRIADPAGLAIILLERGKDQISLQRVALTTITRRRRIAGEVQVLRLEENHGRNGCRVAVHSKGAVAEGLHSHADVVLHEHPAVTAALIPVGRQPITVPE
jgi:hypothetical protein